MKLENDGDCIIWPAKLVSYIVRCSTHKVWDCSAPACAKDISDRLDKMIRDRVGLDSPARG